MKKLLLLTGFIFLLFSCNLREDQKYVIGFSQCTEDAWRNQMDDEMRREILLYDNVDLKIENAKGSSKKQKYQIRQLLKSGIDLLIVSPNEENVAEAIYEAQSKDIPVILVDRKIGTDHYHSFIGADNYKVGEVAANLAIDLLGEKGRIVELKGLTESSPARLRHLGFKNVIEQKSTLQIIESLHGEWLAEGTEKVFTPFLTKQIPFDFVYAQNDIMALKVHELLEKNGLADKVQVIGVDALLGANRGIQAVIEGKLNASILYPTGGDKAIQVAMKILKGEAFEKEYTLPIAQIDKKNAHILQLQLEQIMLHQHKLAAQQDRLSELKVLYQNQSSLLAGTFISMGLLIILAFFVFYAYQQKSKLSMKLEKQNAEIKKKSEEISKQRDEILSISNELKQVTETKDRFFTNVSHEFRTPLTLILSPLKDLDKSSLTAANAQLISLMQRNANRLLRLTNELLDFQKINSGKIRLKVSQNNIIDQIDELLANFEFQAKKKHIQIVSEIDTEESLAWYDFEKFDKVVFNLLSNALKFSPENSTIELRIEQTSTLLKVEVRDNGLGMSSEELAHVFDRFYQGKENQYIGTGIGLSLCKEFVELHGGEIYAESQEGKGAVFSFFIPIAKDSYTENVLIKSVSHFTAPEPKSMEWEAQEETVKENRPTILVVDDDADVLAYLKTILSIDYNLLLAENGREGIELARKEMPKLIVSDVMMPEINGVELSQTLKSDERTGHIPIVLLTAKTSIENKLEGLETGADAYIEKPFDKAYLLLRIRKLIEQRESLYAYYQKQLLSMPHIQTEQVETQTISVPTAEQNFVKKVKAVMEENFRNSEFSVEQMGQEVGLSRIHLYRKLKAISNMTPSEYLRIFRLEKSVELVKDNNWNISEIAYEVGFSSPAYFTKCFKEAYGEHPTAYRKKLE